MSVSRRLRYEVMRRDNHACRYCGAAAPNAELTVDHVIPVALGGTDEPSNLVTACADCNAGKSASSPDAALVDDVRQDALRWSRAIERAGEAMLAARDQHEQMLAPFVERWNEWSPIDWRGNRTGPLPLPHGWQDSVQRILAAGLPMPILADCVDIAMDRKGVTDVFRYMCGIAWNRVHEVQSIAMALGCDELPELHEIAIAQAEAKSEPRPLAWPRNRGRFTSESARKANCKRWHWQPCDDDYCSPTAATGRESDAVVPARRGLPLPPEDHGCG